MMTAPAAADDKRVLCPEVTTSGIWSLFKSFRGTPFFRNVLVMMSGSVLAQAFGFALSPVVSRLFTETDFGLFGSFIAVTGVLNALATLDYSQAIMLPKAKEDAVQVFLLSCFATIVVTVLCAAACLVVPGWLAGLLKARSSWLLALLVLSVFVGGLNGSLQAWCVRIKAFRHTSVSQVVRGLSSNGLQVGFGIAGIGALGLVVSSVLADLLASLNLLWLMRKDLPSFFLGVTRERLKRLALDYGDFPAYSATQNLLNALSVGLPVLLLTHYFGLAVAGAYAFGIRLINAPVNLITNALRQVLFQKASEMQHQGRTLTPLFVKSTAALFAIGLLPALVLGAWSPQLFAWVFGSRWYDAGEFARYLVLWLLLAFCNLPAILFARLIRIQRALFLYNILVLAVRVMVLVIGGSYCTAIQSIIFFSLVGAVLNFVLIVFVARALLKIESLSFSLALLRD